MLFRSLPVAHRCQQVAAIEQVKHLAHHQRVDRYGAGGFEAVAARGLRRITSGSACSDDSASVTALTMFTHRICTGVSGSAMPNRIAISTMPAAPPLIGRMKTMALILS